MNDLVERGWEPQSGNDSETMAEWVKRRGFLLKASIQIQRSGEIRGIIKSSYTGNSLILHDLQSPHDAADRLEKALEAVCPKTHEFQAAVGADLALAS